MGSFEVAVLSVVGIVGIGCLTGVVVSAMDKLFDRRLRGAQEELARARDRIAQLEARVADLQIHNEQLGRAQEWTNRLLQAQESGQLPGPR